MLGEMGRILVGQTHTKLPVATNAVEVAAALILGVKLSFALRYVTLFRLVSFAPFPPPTWLFNTANSGLLMRGPVVERLGDP